MPSIYTHHMFGEQILKKLPSNMAHIIKKYRKPFQIGLQGPDFLFFYHPLLKLRPNRFGYKQHRTPAKYFLEPLLPYLREIGTDSPEYAYILGFICHFILDSECHEYVYEKVKQPSFNHLVMEMEFDRFLMEKNGFSPLKFPVYDFIPRDRLTVNTIANIYKPFGITAKEIAASLRGMRFYKRLFTSGKTLKRACIRLAMKLSMRYHELEGYMMDLIPKSHAKITNKDLSICYQKAVKNAIPLIQSFHDGILDAAPLDERFSCDFRSNIVPEK